MQRSGMLGHPPLVAALEGSSPMPRNTSDPSRAEPIDRRGQLLSVMPALAQDLASARRKAPHVRAENGWLVEKVRQLQRGRALRRPPVSLPTSTSGRWR
jgi:hypothetical protein